MTPMEVLDYLRDVNIPSIVLRIVLAMVIGGILGSERGRKNRPAGFRTYMLVSVGATLVMMTNQYVFATFNTSDPVRMGAQVVSGIGFLGAGTIIVTSRNQVKGITTAAGLWTAACSGLAIGIGFYEGAIIGGGAVLIIMAYMQRLDDYIHRKANFIEVYIEFDSNNPFSQFLDYAAEQDLIVTDIQLSKNKLVKGAWFCAVLMVKSKRRMDHAQILQLLQKADGVQHVEEL